MELNLIHPWKRLDNYLARRGDEDAWEQEMVAPFWPRLSEFAPFPADYLKPPAVGWEEAGGLTGLFETMDFDGLAAEFVRIAAALPKEDDDPMTVAFYPSDNRMEEGVYGTGVWGNVVLNLNPRNPGATDWTPFVFAHEYHHNVLGFYWYCVKGGAETKGNLLEALVNEGEADLFAQSLYPDRSPSWHRGVKPEEEAAVWRKFREALFTAGPTEEFAPYLFGDSGRGIPENAGYHFGCRMVRSYLERNPGLGFSRLIEVPHEEIFRGSDLAET